MVLQRSGSSIRVLLLSLRRTTRMKGKGWLASRLTVHMKPMTPAPTQAPVMRESARMSQLTLPGPGAEYAPPVHARTFTSVDVTLVTLSAHWNTRIWLCELWLPKYMVEPAPRQSRREPLFVVVHQR